MLIDSHAHLDDSQFDADREEVIRRAFSSGVEKIINIGAGLGSSARSVEIAQSHENIWATVGLHPHYFMKHGTWNREHKGKLEALAKNKKVVAIGEIGLEYHAYKEKITQKEKDFQKEGFVFQLELARNLELPVVIHCRGERSGEGSAYRERGEAYQDVWEIIQNYPEIRAVFHSFGGRMDMVKKILYRENVFFSFAGNITYNKPESETNSVIRGIPIERIMIETDCPYLAPVPMRGQRNEPAFVGFVADKIYELKGLEKAKLLEITAQNVQSFFDI